MKSAVWLIQLGTPDDPSVPAVKRYLKEFLTDPDVVNLPLLLRAFLVNGLILPFRSPKSAEAYQSIWMDEGSPLLVHSERLTQKLKSTLGQNFEVVLGMRYGNPSIADSWRAIKATGAKEVLVIPLFPQYAKATTGSISKKVVEVMTADPAGVDMEMIPYFYHRPEYLDAVAATAEGFDLESFDHILFSYHGLPVKQIKAVDSHCYRTRDCCAKIEARNEFCYRAHCYATTREVAKRLQLSKSRYTTTFQSRLGPVEWIKPYTDQEMIRLAKEGKKRIAVFSPAFVADCLETLEEITIQGNELFREHGGEEVTLIPSLNDSVNWVQALATIVRGYEFERDDHTSSAAG